MTLIPPPFWHTTSVRFHSTDSTTVLKERYAVAENRPQSGGEKPFLGVHMKCCNVYIRAYVNAKGDAFVGWCPRCATQFRVEIVEKGGSTSRFFEAS